MTAILEARELHAGHIDGILTRPTSDSSSKVFHSKKVKRGQKLS